MKAGRQEFKDVYREVKNSAQYWHLQAAKTRGDLPNLKRIPKTVPLLFHNLHRSTFNDLNARFRPRKTEWCDEVDWSSLIADVKEVIDEMFNPHLAKEFHESYKHKFSIPRDAYDPALRLQTFLKYGVNTGSWETSIKKKLQSKLDNYYSEWSDGFVYYEVPEVKIVTYEELCELYPPASMMRTDATTCYPDYKQQSPDYIAENFLPAINDDYETYVTSYGRQQGGSVSEYVIVLKNRQVYGVAFLIKTKGVWVSYGTKMRKGGMPKCAYYRDWDDIFGEVTIEFNKGTMVADDWQFFDGCFDSHLLKLNRDTWRPHIRKDYIKMFDRAWEEYEKPKMIWNALYYTEHDKDISLSGHSFTPLFETATNVSLHQLDPDLEPLIVYELAQIDDHLMRLDGEYDLEKFYKFHKKTGFTGNPDKAWISTEHGVVEFLKVYVGYVYKDGPATYVGNVYEKIKSLHDKERLNQLESFQIYDTENLITNVESRFIGTMGSFGKNVCVELVDVLLKHLSQTGIYQIIMGHIDELKVVAQEQQYAFSPQWFLDYLKQEGNSYL